MTDQHTRPEFRVLPQYPQYEVDQYGRVYAVGTNWRGYGRRELTRDLNADGYPSVRVTVDGQRRRVSVHWLVAAAFLPERPSVDHEVRHLDGNKMNNCASNLAWGTKTENAADREAHGRTSRGARHSTAIKRGIAAARGEDA